MWVVLRGWRWRPSVSPHHRWVNDVTKWTTGEPILSVNWSESKKRLCKVELQFLLWKIWADLKTAVFRMEFGWAVCQWSCFNVSSTQTEQSCLWWRHTFTSQLHSVHTDFIRCNQITAVMTSSLFLDVYCVMRLNTSSQPSDCLNSDFQAVFLFHTINLTEPKFTFTTSQSRAGGPWPEEEVKMVRFGLKS